MNDLTCEFNKRITNGEGTFVVDISNVGVMLVHAVIHENKTFLINDFYKFNIDGASKDMDIQIQAIIFGGDHDRAFNVLLDRLFTKVKIQSNKH